METETEKTNTSWTQEEAIALCKLVEHLCVPSGCHVALTGGLLYKNGPRKDCDLLFYRIRQIDEIDMDLLWDTLKLGGIEKLSGFGWCYKATFNGKKLDIFFPEEQHGIYAQGDQGTIIDGRK